MKALSLLLALIVFLSVSANAQAPFYCSVDGLPMAPVSPAYAGLSIKELNPFAVGAPPPEDVAILLRDAGVQAVNSRLVWTVLEATQGQFAWELWEPLFDAFTSRGVDPIVAVQTTPVWASSEPTSPNPQAHPPADMAYWTDALTAMVQHYDQVDRWEIWSEPNLDRSWLGTDEEYIELLNAAYTAIHAAREGTEVWGPGIGFNTWNLSNDIGFAQAVIDQGMFDVFTLHLYFFEVSEMAAVIADFRARLDAAGHEDVPLVITEANLVDSIVDCGNYNLLSDEALAEIMTDIYSCFANAGADQVFWFKSTDTGPICAQDQQPTRDGVLDGLGQPKAAYWRLAEIVDYLEAPLSIFADGFESGDAGAWDPP